MAIRRSVVITCDGPCGLVVSSDSIPREWFKVRLNKAREDRKVPNPPSTMGLCPVCTAKLQGILAREGYSFVDFDHQVSDAVVTTVTKDGND